MAPQASIISPGVFVYTGTAVQLVGPLFRGTVSGAVFIRRPALWRRGLFLVTVEEA